jgi:hypothetical protein
VRVGGEVEIDTGDWALTTFVFFAALHFLPFLAK